jgi:hypothetical protein
MAQQTIETDFLGGYRGVAQRRHVIAPAVKHDVAGAVQHCDGVAIRIYGHDLVVWWRDGSVDVEMSGVPLSHAQDVLMRMARLMVWETPLVPYPGYSLTVETAPDAGWMDQPRLPVRSHFRIRPDQVIETEAIEEDTTSWSWVVAGENTAVQFTRQIPDRRAVTAWLRTEYGIGQREIGAQLQTARMLLGVPERPEYSDAMTWQEADRRRLQYENAVREKGWSTPTSGPGAWYPAPPHTMAAALLEAARDGRVVDLLNLLGKMGRYQLAVPTLREAALIVGPDTLWRREQAMQLSVKDLVSWQAGHRRHRPIASLGAR